MIFDKPLTKCISSLLILFLTNAPVYGMQQVGPTERFSGPNELLRDCRTQHANKNLPAARTACEQGLAALKRVEPECASPDCKGYLSQLNPELSGVKNDEDRVTTRCKESDDLMRQAKLISARLKLKEVEQFNASPEYRPADGNLSQKEKEYETVLGDAKSADQKGSRKTAHFLYIRAQKLNVEVPLNKEIAGTGGCYAACKTAWVVGILGAVGGGLYYGVKSGAITVNK